MITISNTRSGELTISAPQGEIDKFLAEAKKWPGCVINQQVGQSANTLVNNCGCQSLTNNTAKPTPLPTRIPVFSRVVDQKTTTRSKAVANGARSASNSRPAGKPEPIEMPRMTFNRAVG